MARVEPPGRPSGPAISGSRGQIVVDLQARVASEAIRAIVRLESDGIDANEAIRMVRAALTELPVDDADLARRLERERGRADTEDAPDDRELGGQG
jgi:hypothetical protein